MIGLHMLHGPLQGTTQQGANFISSSSPSQHPRDGSSGNGGISCLNQPNIVRIPAKTALPIISSVPKCRSSKASRQHPIETVNGSRVSHSTATTTTSSNRQISNINQADQVLLIVNDDHIKGGGVPIIGRRLPSKSMAMRSAAAYTTPDTTIQNNHDEQPEMLQIDYSMLPQTIELDTKVLKNQQQAPVVGRRSHRLIQQQQQQQQQLQRAATVYQQAMFDEQIIRQDPTKKANKRSNKQYDNNQQPLSIVETRLATSQQVHHLLARPMPFDDYHHHHYQQQQQQLSTNRLSSSSNKSAVTNRHTKKLHPVKYQSISIMNIAEPVAEYSLPPMQQVGGRGQKSYFQEIPNIQPSLYDKPKVSGRGGQLAKQAIGISRGVASNLTLGTVQSSSCSSLCSTATATTTANQLNNSTGCANKHANYPRCCSPATVCSSSSEQILDESYCEQACCQPLMESGAYCEQNGCSETTSCNDPSCNILARVQSCCMAIPSTPVKPLKSTTSCTNKQLKQQVVGKACTKLYNQHQQQQLHHHHHHHHHHHDSNHGSHGRQARTTNNHHHHHNNNSNNNHHHHSCQANGSSIREISSKTPSASCRSSSLHDSRRQQVNNSTTSQQQFNQPMLISGRNILPVHPKPNLSQSPHLLLSQQQQCCNNLAAAATTAQQTRKNRAGLNNNVEDNTAVTQMYESLAAELKAKLGDPKMGPILLPPKDYDTMSRKQGRLTGIELRRSTNPQLVGPAASRLNSSSMIAFHHNNRQDSINEEQIVVNSNVNSRNSGMTTTTTPTSSPTGSDSRSSGRSQDDRSLQRSRSNSSSGLGSISMGPSSPSSPPISSNEDMRQTVTTQKSSSSGKNGFSTRLNRGSNDDNDDDDDRRRRRHHHNIASVDDRKNSSPDNCNSSDSGHSGSGRLDSAMSSEERKVLLRDKNHSKTSPLTTSNNSNNNNNNNNNDSNMPTRNVSDNKTGNDRISGAKAFKIKQSVVDQNQVGDEAVGSAGNGSNSSSLRKDETRTKEEAAHSHLNSTKISSSPSSWNGRVEIPLKVNSGKNGNTYLATKQIIY